MYCIIWRIVCYVFFSMVHSREITSYYIFYIISIIDLLSVSEIKFNTQPFQALFCSFLKPADIVEISGNWSCRCVNLRDHNEAFRTA